MKKIVAKIEPADAILSLVGLIGLTGLFLYWRIGHPDTTAAGMCAAVLSAALFAVFGVRLVCAWMGEWRAVKKNETAPILREPVRVSVLVKVFLIFLAASLMPLALVFVFQVIGGSRESFRDALHIWEKLDSQHYLDIAREWYLSDGPWDRLVQLVFLPGYPLAIRLFHLLVGDWLYAGMLVSIVSFSLAGVMLYLLARLDVDHAAALRVLKYALILPGAMFFSAPMSDALFLLLSVSCLYCIRRGLWLPVGLLGGLAAFTRSLGLTLLVPAVYSLVTDMLGERKTPVLRRVRQAASLLLIPAGFGVYCLICRSVSGNAFQFLLYQREHWGQSAGFFFNTAAYQTEAAVSRCQSGELEIFMGLWIPNLVCTFGALIVMALAVRRLRPAYSMYFLAYYAVAVGTTWLLSAPRYLAACMPLSLGLASLTEDRRADDAMTVLLVILYVLYAQFMALRWQVW